MQVTLKEAYAASSEILVVDVVELSLVCSRHGVSYE